MSARPPVHDAEQILDAIGRDIGIEDLSFDARGHRALLFTSGRHFGFQKAGSELLVYVAEPIRYDIAGTLMEAMKRAQATQTEWTVQVMLREDRRSNNTDPTCLMAMIRLSGQHASISYAQSALAYLSEWNPSQGNA